MARKPLRPVVLLSLDLTKVLATFPNVRSFRKAQRNNKFSFSYRAFVRMFYGDCELVTNVNNLINED